MASPIADRDLPPTARTTVKRHPERGTRSVAEIHAILDEALVCHASVVVDDGPRVLPMAHVRIGDQVYVHGARANRLLGALASGRPSCVAVTLLDGLVFGRTWFHHSMNYRCVVLYGAGAEVIDPGERMTALTALVEKAAPGRSREARAPTPAELAGTLVVRFPVSEGSAKVRSGPPLDEDDLLADDCWAGVLPMRSAVAPPVPDPRLRPGVAPSLSVGERARGLASAAFTAYVRVRDGVVVSTDPSRIDFDVVHRFLAEESYWARGVEAWRQRQAMAHSIAFGMYRGATQIGFARVLTDHARAAYLADVFVVPEERGNGLGKWLVECMLEHPDAAGVDRWLLGTADAHGLYERFGFERVEGRYMVRRRK
jgi:nitroimidazol reductase NimA-like FMN-containing flavoprotein (pyridoxamine 5'-phosphate oxidase superfamily)/GNAT superfamily N-acetyltransferase